ncbi:MAG: STAS domain-containing protein [Acidobacteriota bacterium]|nr:STAS domain-containing protein [Acidobacteriota bacterium]
MKDRTALIPALTSGRLKLRGELVFIDRQDIRKAMLPLETLDHVIVDVSGVTNVDSTVLGCLIRLMEIRRVKGWLRAISIIGASAKIRRTFETTGLGRVFNMDDVDVSNISFTEDTTYSSGAVI